LDTTEDIYRIKEEINLVLKEINNAHLIDDIYNRIDVISEFLNSIKGQHYGSRFCIQVYEIPSDLIAESHSKKELEIKMLRTLNDMKFKELGIQNIFVYR
jgi:hypothetical protein